MLARGLTTTLPAVTLAETIGTTRVHSVAGRTGERTALVTARPFRTPHHTIDELPEFRRHVLEVLRQPREDSVTRIQSPTRPGLDGFGRLGSAIQGDHGLAPGACSTFLRSLSPPVG
jgi:predicted ATPase with chaperone activity